MIDLIEIIQHILQAKKDARKAPLIVSTEEIEKSVECQVVEELRRLYTEGKINHHETLNGHAFSIPE